MCLRRRMTGGSKRVGRREGGEMLRGYVQCAIGQGRGGAEGGVESKKQEKKRKNMMMIDGCTISRTRRQTKRGREGGKGKKRLHSLYQ